MMRLTYRYGNEHNPAFRTGRHRLEINDGDMSLLRVTSADSRRWSGSLDDVTVSRIGELLRTAGFPNAPMLRLPADSPTRHLTVSSAAPGHDDSMMLPWSEALEVPGYAELFGFLDTLVESIVAGTPDHVGSPTDETEQPVVPPRIDPAANRNTPRS
jgi:hypothetical protein